MVTLAQVEKKIEKIYENPTQRKLDNFECTSRYFVEDLEYDTVEEQNDVCEHSPKYKKLEKIIDRCNAVYERITDCQLKLDEMKEVTK